MLAPTCRRVAQSSSQARALPLVSRARISSSSSLTRPALSSTVSHRTFSTARTRQSDSSSDTPALPSSYLPRPSEIHAIPFNRSPEAATKALEIGAMAHSALLSRSFLAGIIFSLAASMPSLPFFQSARCELVDIKPVYLPGWSVKADVAVQTEGGDEISIKTGASFFPGTSFHPLSQMILGPTLYDLPAGLPKYKPSRDLDQHSEPITPIPFDTSPLILPSLLRDSLPISLGSVDVEDSIATEPEWSTLDCVPIYVPLYVARFQHEKRGQDFTIVLESGNKTPGNYTMHFPSTAPLLSMSSPRHIQRPIIQMVYRKSSLQAPLPSWLVPALALNVSSPTLKTGGSEGKHGYRDSLSSRLSAVMEAWVEGGGREVLRERSIGEVKEGGFEGRIVEWEEVEKGGYAKEVEDGR